MFRLTWVLDQRSI